MKKTGNPGTQLSRSTLLILSYLITALSYPPLIQSVWNGSWEPLLTETSTLWFLDPLVLENLLMFLSFCKLNYPKTSKLSLLVSPPRPLLTRLRITLTIRWPREEPESMDLKLEDATALSLMILTCLKRKNTALNLQLKSLDNSVITRAGTNARVRRSLSTELKIWSSLLLWVLPVVVALLFLLAYRDTSTFWPSLISKTKLLELFTELLVKPSTLLSLKKLETASSPLLKLS